MSILSRSLTKDDCNKWNLKKNINPLTNSKISPNSKIFKEIKSQCEKLGIGNTNNNKLQRDLLLEDCILWSKNKNLNPITKITLNDDSKILKEIKDRCQKILKDNEDKIKQYEEQSKSKVIKVQTKSKEESKTKEPLKNVIKEKSLLSRELLLEDCIFWNNNKNKNPITKYSLKEDSKILKEIKERCTKILKDINDKIKSDKREEIGEKSVSLKEEDSKYSKSISPIQKKIITKDNKLNENELYYPDIDDEDFNKKLINLYEFNVHKIPEYNKLENIEDFNNNSEKLCGKFEKTNYQYLMAHYISKRSPYNSILMYHGVGVGKTCSSITVAEGFLTDKSINDEPTIWVVMPLSLKGSFKEQVFNMSSLDNYNYIEEQCTGDNYIKMAHIDKKFEKEKIRTRIKKLIKSRYIVFTYDAFASFIEKEYIENNKKVENKVIIIDEAHNIRSGDNNVNKKIYSSLIKILPEGINNKLILLSATPMYNEPSDIFDLLYLLLLNDKKLDILKPPFEDIFDKSNNIKKSLEKIIKKLSNNYISYLRGKNPFTFALKLSPKYSNIKVLENIIEKDINGNNIPINDKNWIKNIEDDIIPSKLGTNQVIYIKDKEYNDENNVFNNLQPMNIVYDIDIGEKGFNTFFTKTDGNEPLNVKYNKKYDLSLYPNKENLGKYSGKILKICNIIKNTKGVIVIYSRFIWSGILPIAIALEHMGFNREGTRNILNNPKIIEDKPNYGYKRNPKYCILSSENREIMGNTTIDNLIKIINKPQNIDGSEIKVILMTPVAGEGLSFFNIREIHLLEPWYHYNRVKQIIGRGIRNCRHQSLPLEERNCTVYMHGAISNENIETPDIHAYRIASRKLIQTNKLDKIIRDNAIDCYLMKHSNYFSKNIFENLKIKINTSQNKSIEYLYGDDDIYNPKCNIDLDNMEEITEKKDINFRKETYKQFIPNVKNLLKKLIEKEINEGNRFILIDTIIDNIKLDNKIILEGIKQSCYPNILLKNYILIPHQEGIHIVNINNNTPTKLRIVENVKELEDKKGEEKVISNTKCFKEKLNMDDIYIATNAIYSSIDSDCYIKVVKHIIENQNNLTNTDKYIAKCLYLQGALISYKELPNIEKEKGNIYIGYVNIFNTNFEPFLYKEKKYVKLTRTELDDLINIRNEIKIPENMEKEKLLWGLYTPNILKKNSNIYINQFKLLLNGESVGKKTGIVCTSLKKKEQDEIIKQLGKNDIYNTKLQYCNNISIELLKIGRISLYPIYKPTILSI